MEANARILSISRDPNNAMSFGDRKSSYHHDLQLEELRNLQVRHRNIPFDERVFELRCLLLFFSTQEALNNDRKSFEKEKTKQNLEIHNERQEIRAENDEITKQKVSAARHARVALLQKIVTLSPCIYVTERVKGAARENPA